MSDYTTQLRFICETCAGLEESVGYKGVNEVISLARTKIFDFEYPIFDTNYKSVLESKILKHYYTREICEETYGLWKLRLDARLNEIMPYYNQLYESEKLSFNPLQDYEISKEYSKDGNQSGSESSTITESEDRTSEHMLTGTDSLTKDLTDTKSLSGTYEGDKTVTNTVDNLSKFADTPQGGLTDIKNGEYLTNATHNEGNTSEVADEDSKYSQSGTDTHKGTETTIRTKSNTVTDEIAKSVTDTKENELTTTESYLEKISGKQSGNSYSHLLNEFRTTFLNIDKMVIDELRDLFFGLW